MTRTTKLRRSCIAIAVAQAFTANISHAATFRVSNGLDGTTSCTMREALHNINNQVASPTNGCFNRSSNSIGTDDTIEFGVTTISLDSILTITEDVDINPNGSLVVFSGSGDERVFDILSATVSMRSVSIRNGFADDGNPSDDSLGDIGGGIRLEDSFLTLTDSLVTSNRAAHRGGGIYHVVSTLTLQNTTVSANTAREGGGLGPFFATTIIEDSSISNNEARQGAGGGIFVGRGSNITMNNSIVHNNRARSTNTMDTTIQGGGLYVEYNSTVILNSTTVSSNTANLGGGLALTGPSTVNVHSSTVSDNSAIISGGGFFNDDTTTTLTNSTVSGNSARDDGGGFLNQGATILNNSTVSDNSVRLLGGGFLNPDGVITITNSMIVGNTALVGSDSFNLAMITANNSLFGSSFNFDPITNPPDNNIVVNLSSINLNSILLPLTDNGGPTMTHALAAGSPAIDAANNALCAAAPINNKDQRGVTRSACDIGAYEFQQDTSFFVIPLSNGKSVIFEL